MMTEKESENRNEQENLKILEKLKEILQNKTKTSLKIIQIFDNLY